VTSAVTSAEPDRRVAARATSAEAGGIVKAVPEPSQHSFHRAVVAVNGGPSDARIVQAACELARTTKGKLTAVHVVEVGWNLPLDADVAGRSEEAQRVLDLVEATAETERMTIETILLQARDVGAALVDEASEREADVLILGLPYRKRFGGDFAIGRTVPYVLKNAACAVMVIREPMAEELTG
jgi:nucleotide-binding universal stress UspA family protein